MRISTEVVRKLARLDPALREVFYSFLDEIERDEEADPLSTTISQMRMDLERLRKEVESTRALLPVVEETSRQIGMLREAVEGITKRLEEVALKQQQLDTRMEGLCKAEKNGSSERGVTSQIEQTINQFKEAVEEKIASFSSEIETLKERLSSGKRMDVLRNLSRLLKKRISLNLKEHIRSRKFKVGGRDISFDIFAPGTKNKKKCTLIGRVTERPHKEDIEELDRDVNLLVEEKELPQNVVRILVVEEIEEDVEKFASKKGIFVVWNQDL